MASPLLTVAPPSADLRTAIRAILAPSWSAQAVIDAMLLAKGSIGAAGAVAHRLGLRNRFELAAWFTRQGLPPMHELAGWIRVLNWLEQWEQAGVALCPKAISEGRDPAACYRLVQRVTGTSWGQVQTAGLSWALDRFAERCRHRLQPPASMDRAPSLPAELGRTHGRGALPRSLASRARPRPRLARQG